MPARAEYLSEDAQALFDRPPAFDAPDLSLVPDEVLRGRFERRGGLRPARGSEAIVFIPEAFVLPLEEEESPSFVPSSEREADAPAVGREADLLVQEVISRLFV